MENKKEVWIVEDDEGISEVTTLILNEYGYAPQVIKTSQELFTRLKTQWPSLILLDIFLNDTNGVEVLKKIKSNFRLSSIPIVLMSADTQIEAKAKEAGADDYLKKPFELTDFLKKVEKYTQNGLN